MLLFEENQSSIPMNISVQYNYDVSELEKVGQVFRWDYFKESVYYKLFSNTCSKIFHYIPVIGTRPAKLSGAFWLYL